MLVSGKAEVKTVDWSEDSQVFPAILFFGGNLRLSFQEARLLLKALRMPEPRIV